MSCRRATKGYQPAVRTSRRGSTAAAARRTANGTRSRTVDISEPTRFGGADQSSGRQSGGHVHTYASIGTLAHPRRTRAYTRACARTHARLSRPSIFSSRSFSLRAARARKEAHGKTPALAPVWLLWQVSRMQPLAVNTPTLPPARHSDGQEKPANPRRPHTAQVHVTQPIRNAGSVSVFRSRTRSGATDANRAVTSHCAAVGSTTLWYRVAILPPPPPPPPPPPQAISSAIPPAIPPAATQLVESHRKQTTRAAAPSPAPTDAHLRGFTQSAPFPLRPIPTSVHSHFGPFPVRPIPTYAHSQFIPTWAQL
jgi:hypothetical protein